MPLRASALTACAPVEGNEMLITPILWTFGFEFAGTAHEGGRLPKAGIKFTSFQSFDRGWLA